MHGALVATAFLSGARRDCGSPLPGRSGFLAFASECKGPDALGFLTSFGMTNGTWPTGRSSPRLPSRLRVTPFAPSFANSSLQQARQELRQHLHGRVRHRQQRAVALREHIARLCRTPPSPSRPARRSAGAGSPSRSSTLWSMSSQSLRMMRLSREKSNTYQLSGSSAPSTTTPTR